MRLVRGGKPRAGAGVFAMAARSAADAWKSHRPKATATARLAAQSSTRTGAAATRQNSSDCAHSRAEKLPQLREFPDKTNNKRINSGMTNMAKPKRKRAARREEPGKIGYDGVAPEFRPVRDIEGRGKRAVDGVQNINTDRLEWLLAHKLIEPHHHAAGRKLQGFAEKAVISPKVSLVGGGGHGGSSSISDAQCDGVHEINRARAAISPINWRVIELVVIDGVSAEKAAARMRINARAAIPMLCAALDQLGRHYRLC